MPRGTITKIDAVYQKDGKDRQNCMVNLPGVGEVKGWGFPDALEGAYVGGTIELSLNGKYYNIQKGTFQAAQPGDPVPATPPTGNGYTPPGYDHAAMQQRAANITALALQIAKEVRESTTFAMAEDSVIASMTATILIQTRP
jgi:hypothetical protein